MNDIRYAFRRLRRSPGFTTAAVLTLALGIGANTAIYSVLQAVWIDAAPFADPSRLVFLSSAGEFSKTMAVSEEDFEDWRGQARAFESMAALDYGGQVTIDGRTLHATRASADLFTTLAAPMALGRPLLPSDSRPDAPAVAVLGHRVWQRDFGSAPAILGRTFQSQVGPVEIVGVAPPDFQLSGTPFAVLASRRLVPLPPGVRGGRSLQVVARLAPGVSLDDARSEMNTIAARLATERPASNAAWPAVTVTPVREKLAGAGVGQSLWLLLAATGVVLLIACANIANLFLARGSNRRRELAVRATVGARPVHLVRQVLCESTLVAAVGTAAGILVAAWARDGIVAVMPFNLHRASEIAVDTRVLAFTALMGMLASLFTGLLPAIRGAKASPHDLLAGAPGQYSATRARRTLAATLVGAEVALAVAVLSVAALLVNSFVKLRAVDPGFTPDGLLTFAVTPSAPNEVTTESARTIHRQIIEALVAVPNVQAATGGEMLPVIGNRSSYPFTVVGEPGRADPGEGGSARKVDLDVRYVADGYFDVMDIPIKEGRSFVPSGDPPRAIVVNERAARELWPGQFALGKQLMSPGGPETIIGIVGNVRHSGLHTEPVAEVYRRSTSSLDLTYIVRASGSPQGLARSVTAAVEAAAPVKVGSLSTFDELVDQSVRGPQFRARLFGLMGLLVVGLALIGVFSITAYAVAERRREIGIRMALGARPSRTVRLIMAQTSLPVLIGLMVGFTLALSTNHLVSHFLFATSPTDGLTMGGVVVAVLATALLAAYLPARRALQVDPTVALRAE